MLLVRYQTRSSNFFRSVAVATTRKVSTESSLSSPSSPSSPPSSSSFKFIQHSSSNNSSSPGSKPPRPSTENSSVDFSKIEMKIRSVEQDPHINSIDTTTACQTESSSLSLSTAVSSPLQKGEAADTTTTTATTTATATSDRDTASAEIQRNTQEQHGSSIPPAPPSPVRHSVISSKPPLPTPSKRHTTSSSSSSRLEKGVTGIGSAQQQVNKERSPQKDSGSRGLDPTHSSHLPERSSTPASHLFMRSSTPAQHLFEQYNDDSSDSHKYFEEYLEDRPIMSNAGSSTYPSFKKITVPSERADAPSERAGREGAVLLTAATRSTTLTAATGESSPVRTFQKRTKV